MISEDDRDYIVTRFGHRFSETAYSNLFGCHGSFKEYVQTAKMSSYGLSTEQIADVKEARRANHFRMAESVKPKM